MPGWVVLDDEPKPKPSGGWVVLDDEPSVTKAGLLDRAGTAVQAAVDQPGEALKGAGKGLVGSALGALELAHKVSPMGMLQGAGVLPRTPMEKAGLFEQARKEYAPSNPAQQTGQFVEKAAEFFLPAGLGLRAAKGAGLAANAAREALGTGAVSAIQSGGDPAQTVTGAALGAVAPALGALATRAGKPVSEKVIASLIRPLQKNLRFGANPAKAVAEEGIVANSLPALGEAVAKRAAEYGAQVDQYLGQAGVAGKKVDLRPALALLDDAIKEAREAGERGLAGQLNTLRKAKILDSEEVTPAVATMIKRQIGKFTAWNDPTKQTLNAVKQRLYGEINKALETAVPGVKRLNRRWGDLIEAASAIEQRTGVAARHAPISLADAAFGGASWIGTAEPVAGAAAIAAKRALSSTPVVSRIARAAGKERPNVLTLDALIKSYLAARGQTPSGQGFPVP